MRLDEGTLVYNRKNLHKRFGYYHIGDVCGGEPGSGPAMMP